MVLFEFGDGANRDERKKANEKAREGEKEVGIPRNREIGSVVAIQVCWDAAEISKVLPFSLFGCACHWQSASVCTLENWAIEGDEEFYRRLRFICVWREI